MNVAEELKDRFIGMYFFVMKGMEFRPGFILTDEEYGVARRFEVLHDSVDSIPEHVRIATEALVAKTEPLVFERHLQGGNRSGWTFRIFQERYGIPAVAQLRTRARL